MKHNELTVQIMAGGKSTRMGQDKAGVLLDGKTLLEHALELWTGFGRAMQLSVGPEGRIGLAPEGVRAVADVYPERGPLGGLHAGLLVCQTDLLLLAAVDAPFVTREMGEALLLGIDGGEAHDACVYSLDGRPQPLFGLYRKRCLPVVEELLAAGENKMGLLLRRVDTVYLVGAGERHFRNLNTPEELARAQSEGKSLCKKNIENSLT